MRKLWIIAAVVCFAARNAAAALVWIDTDVSIGSPIREVDDAYALVLALHSPEIRIAGVSTSYGNARLGQTTRAAKDLIRRFGRSAGAATNIYSGARSAQDLGRRTVATDALAAALEKDRITYVALGPLTNLATFLRLHPELASRLKRVVFLGGQEPGTSLVFGPRRSFRIHDANVFKDPAATAMVLCSKIPLTLIPVATAGRLQLDRADLRQLEKSGYAGSYLARRSRIWLWFWTNIIREKGGAIFDAVAIIAVAKPELVRMKKRYARLDRNGDLLVGADGSRPATYCTSLGPETKRWVLQRLMSRPQPRMRKAGD